MKPILILQHLSGDGPAYFGRWLREQGVPVDCRDTEAGHDYPARLDGHAALAVLGGEMSANDPLPSLRQAERLILQAMDAGKPVIGHCLGGQLMARALGARVIDSPRPEVGWQTMEVLDEPGATAWFGRSGSFTVYQWHYEAFELPAGARLLARSPACPRQAFAVGPHLGMQFHVEVDAAKVDRWSREDGERWRTARRASPETVQDGTAMRAAIERELPTHQALARQLYGQWLARVPLD